MNRDAVVYAHVGLFKQDVQLAVQNQSGISKRVVVDQIKYLEERLKLTVNREKSRTVSVFVIRNFKFLGFALGRNGMTKERLINSGFYDLATAYQSVHVNY